MFHSFSLNNLLTLPIFLSQDCCYLFCTGTVRGGWRIKEGGSSQAVGLGRANNTGILGSWLKQIQHSGTVQPDEQGVRLGFREVEGSCHILSMTFGSSVNQSTWNRLVNYFPTPKYRPPVRSYLTRPPPALHHSQCCPVSENLTCLSEREPLPQHGEPGQGSWGQSLHSLMIPASGCLQWLCLKSSVDPGVAFHLSVCFCL